MKMGFPWDLKKILNCSSMGLDSQKVNKLSRVKLKNRFACTIFDML